METIQKYEIKPTTPEELESTLVEFDEHVQTAFNVDEAQRQFNELMHTLHQKRTEMQQTIKNLEKTKNTLKQELRTRNAEEAKLTITISTFEDQKATIEESIILNKEQREKVQAEKEKISVLMGSLKAAIEEMRTKLSDL